MFLIVNQLSWLNRDWRSILERAHLHMNLLEPFIAFRRVLLQILSCEDSTMQHLLQSASTLRKVFQRFIFGKAILAPIFYFPCCLCFSSFTRALDSLKLLRSCMNISFSVLNQENELHPCIGLEGYKITPLFPHLLTNLVYAL